MPVNIKKNFLRKKSKKVPMKKKVGQSCIFVFEMDLKTKKFNCTFIVVATWTNHGIEKLYRIIKNVYMYTVTCISYKSVY